MEAKFTNGNHLNWENMEGLPHFCEHCEKAIYNGEMPMDEEGNIDWDEVQCDGHATIYLPHDSNIDPQELLIKGETLEQHVKWYIWHDTNGNHVTLVGNVPTNYYLED